MWASVAPGALALMALTGSAIAGPHDALITKHASTYGVPESLVRRVIHIESKGNPRVISKGNYGLMQIRLGTAQSMGYHGTAEGLLDADTNMTYAVKYLASAYRAAGCSEERAISYYQRGFYKKPTSKCAMPSQPNVQIASKDSSAAVQRSGVAQRDAAPPPADVLRPKVVQVETFVRPKMPNAQPQVQPAVQLAAAPAAAPAPVAEPKPAAVQLPQSPPLPVAAKRPDVTPPPQTTMAKVSDAEESWPPAVPLETTIMAMLPMPKPRPAKAPKTFAKLEPTNVESPAEGVKSSDAAETHMAKLDDAAVPLPQPKPKPDFDAAPAHESKPSHRASRHHVRYARTKPEKPALLAFIEKLTTPSRPSRRRR